MGGSGEGRDGVVGGVVGRRRLCRESCQVSFPLDTFCRSRRAVEGLGNRPIPVDSIPCRGKVCSIAKKRISRGAFLLGGRPVPGIFDRTPIEQANEHPQVPPPARKSSIQALS